MTGIGGKMHDDIEVPVTSAIHGSQRLSRIGALLNSLTQSLDMAARGYLCAPMVDCDPLTDPECTEAGKKLLIPDLKQDAAGPAMITDTHAKALSSQS